MSSVWGGSRVHIFISYRRGLDDGLKVKIAHVLARSFESAELFIDEPPALAWPMTPHEMADVRKDGVLRRSADGKRSKDDRRRRPHDEKTLEGADAIVVVCQRQAELDELQRYANGDPVEFGGCRPGGISDNKFFAVTQDGGAVAHDSRLEKSEYFRHCIFMQLQAREYNPENPAIESSGISEIIDFHSSSTVSAEKYGAFKSEVDIFFGFDLLNVDKNLRQQPTERRFAGKSSDTVKSNALSAVDLMTYNLFVKELSSIGIRCAAIGGFIGCGPSSASVLPAGGRAAGAASVAIRQERNMPRQGDTEAARSVVRSRPREKKRKIVCQVVLPASIGPAGDDIADSLIESQLSLTPETPAVPADEADDPPLLEEISLRNFGRNIDRLIADMANEREPVRPNGRSRK